MIPAYLKRKDIKKMFSCGDTAVQNGINFIRMHPERYLYAGELNGAIHRGAFADALHFYKTDPDAISSLPEFDPIKLLEMTEVWQ